MPSAYFNEYSLDLKFTFVSKPDFNVSKLHVKYNGYPAIPYAQRCNKEWIILCDTLGSVVSNLSCGVNSTPLAKKKINLPHQCY